LPLEIVVIRQFLGEVFSEIFVSKPKPQDISSALELAFKVEREHCGKVRQDDRDHSLMLRVGKVGISGSLVQKGHDKALTPRPIETLRATVWSSFKRIQSRN